MKMGRPKMAKAERKVKITGVRLKSDERDLVERAAAKKEQTLSEWVRETLVTTAENQLR